MGNFYSGYEDILPCHNNTTQCNHLFVNIHDGVNYLSIVINILHLLILSQMREIKATKYFWILVNISISDIMYSISSILYFNCWVKQSILQLSIPTAHWISKFIIAVVGSGTTFRYLVFLVLSTEKYIGVCHPYKYSTHFFINNIKSISGLIYLLGLLVSFALTMIPEMKFCWTTLKIQYVSATIEYKVVYLLYGAINLALSVLITCILVKVWRELKAMSQRNSNEDKLVISVSKYTIWCYIFYQFNILLVVVFVLCQTFNVFLAIATVVEATSAVLLSIYGIGNIFMFIYFHPKYIDRVKSILNCCPRAHIVVRPANLN